MSRIEQLFTDKIRKVLNIYCTAGFPQLDSTIVTIKALQKHGADMIELGMPYSDPLADGQVIQHSSAVALQNGMTIKRLFEQLWDFRKSTSADSDEGVGEALPVVLMGYMNPVLQYGFEKFCEDAAACGVDGLIIPDLPEYEFETVYGSVIKKHGLDFIFLVTPETSDERIKKLDSLSSGFLYAVSSSSTTGGDNIGSNLEVYIKRIKGLGLKNPVLVGFGIKDKTSFQAACTVADGAIIGSAYIKALENSTDVNATTKSFLTSIIG